MEEPVEYVWPRLHGSAAELHPTDEQPSRREWLNNLANKCDNAWMNTFDWVSSLVGACSDGKEDSLSWAIVFHYPLLDHHLGHHLGAWPRLDEQTHPDGPHLGECFVWVDSLAGMCIDTRMCSLAQLLTIAWMNPLAWINRLAGMTSRAWASIAWMIGLVWMKWLAKSCTDTLLQPRPDAQLRLNEQPRLDG